MSLKNTKKHYGSVAKWLHWSIFLAIVGLLLSGHFMGDIPNPAWRTVGYIAHKSFGVSVFILTAFRVAWAFNNTHPDLPANTQKFERIIARATQGLLYLALLVIPLSGWLMTAYKGHKISFFGLFYFPTLPVEINRPTGHFWYEVHELAAWTLLVLVCCHALAALKHHFIDKDNVLKTMLPGRHD